MGLINITGAAGTVLPTGNVSSNVIKRVQIVCDTSGRTFFPLWSISDQGNIQYSGGIIFPASPAALSFRLNDEVQDTTVSSPPTGVGLEADVRILVSPKH